MPFDDVAFEWSDICYRVRTSKKGRDALGRKQWILGGVSGYARKGRLLAIMGPSGCGKTTLLNIFSSRLNLQSGSALGGEIAWHVSGPLAYVPQEVSFFTNCTVRETLTLAARLRRGEVDPAQGDTDIDADVEGAIRRLGITQCADTRVGGEKEGTAVAGCSGGERRRLAIGEETVGRAGGTALAALLADEPTTGLDSFQADKMIKKLSETAREAGCAVVATLHQPRSASFALCDDLLLVAPGGRTVYMGPTSEALSWFTSLGHACPPSSNPAEFLLDLVSVDTGTAADEAEGRTRIARLVLAWADAQSELRRATAGSNGAPAGAPAAAVSSSTPLALPKGVRPPAPAKVTGSGVWVGEAAAANKAKANGATPAAAPQHRPLGPLRVFGLLLGRSVAQARRNAPAHATRLAAHVVLGLVFGGMNRNLGRSQKSVQRRAALLLQVSINTAMMSVITSLTTFPKERSVVRREMARGTHPGCGGYPALPYFLSKVIVDTPIDAFFPVVFGAIFAPLAGLQQGGRLKLLMGLALESVAASSVGLSVSLLSPTQEAANAVGPLLMMLSTLLADSGGMFAEVPEFLQPVSKLSLIKWGFEGSMASEFPGLEFEPPNGDLPPGAPTSGRAAAEARAAAARMGVRTGEEVLRRMGVTRGCGPAAVAQTRVIAFNLGVTYLALRALGTGKVSALRLDPSVRPPPLPRPPPQAQMGEEGAVSGGRC